MSNLVIEDMLCNLHDIKNMARLHQFGDLPKDNDGSGFTINDCLDDCIQKLQEELWALNHFTFLLS